jgi:glycosyltransferase involved in cell wall biosynthesis
MRVVLVTHYYPAHRSGVELAAGELARRLAAAPDMEIDWHASDCDPPPSQGCPRLRCQPAGSFNGLERWLGLPYPLWSWSALTRLVRAVREADLLHLHDCLYFGNVVAFAAARLAGRPVVVTQHIGMVPYRNPGLRLLLAFANRALGRIVLGGACRVLFISETTRAYFARLVRFRKAPLLVANGVDGRLFAPATATEREAARKRLGVPEGRPLVLFVGRFVEKKGLRLLRRLVGALPEAAWIFAGGGPLDPERWGEPNVRVLRGLDQAGLAPLYQAADLLVLPSVGEGFPLVVQEAMACGTQALVDESTARACPPAAGLLRAEPVGGEDAAARWLHRIRALLREGGDPALRARLAGFARENWSWDECARRHAEVMRECAAR